MVRQFDQRSATFYAHVRHLARVLLVIDALLSIMSWALLLYASTHSFEQHPRWMGPLDGVVAFMVVILTVMIERSYRGHIPDGMTQLAHTWAMYLVPALLTLMFIFQHQLIWNTLLPGLAWRMYVLLLILPASHAAFRSREPNA